ncbi:DmsE family decaheme c-type cytochrome [Herbaspirillum sp. ST 5-3]|uniref:DmsE family decaheme c-type cytochrome n=1 Tax=Oxalobacteraceae TaxID=75682 RepID=UPI0010A33138|nr:DmsE family decaheme c-type cytochrome [Herbaspirillum sp. ST 5-3]
MKLWQKLVALAAITVSTAFAGSALAADDVKPAGRSLDPNSTVAKALEKDKVCTECHDESEERPILAMYKTRHGVKADARTPGCQTCHGPSEAHVKTATKDSKGRRPAPDRMFNGAKKADAREVNETCLTCHKSGKRTLWEGSKHETQDVSCVSCHQVHVQGKDKALDRVAQRDVCFACHKTERAEMMRPSTHPIQAGKVTCSDCHNTHGSQGPKLMADITVRDTCFNCHAEKRGPFLWEHPSAMDDCGNCHTPHGSTAAPLLKGRSPWICQNCHADGAPHPGNLYSGAYLPGGAASNANTRSALASVINPVTGQSVTLNNPASQLALRACTNCHSQVHGSNHPAGKRFTR